MRIHIRNRYLMGFDAIALIACVFCAYALRFEGWPLPPQHLHAALIFAAIIVPVKIAIFFPAGLYRRIWSYASVTDLERIAAGLAIATVASVFIGILLLPLSGLLPVRLPWSVLAMDSLLGAIAIISPRLLYRVLAWHHRRSRSEDGVPAIIVGPDLQVR
jgi:FlaA1/EpsC-like NDP-sugar epimerase